MNERQKILLKEIVESYIKDAHPVGSKALVQKLKCSSATIRNEMSALEEIWKKLILPVDVFLQKKGTSIMSIIS